MPKLTLLVGPIASGKTTYAAKSFPAEALRISDDELVLAVHGRRYEEYSDDLKPLYVALETAILTHAAMNGRDVVFDAGCRTKQKRQRILNLGKALGFEVHAVVFPWDAPWVHARRRFEHDSRGLSYEKWLSIARHHRDTYQPVTPDEGFTTITEGVFHAGQS